MEAGSLLPNEWLMVVLYVLGVLVWGYRLRGRASKSLEDSFFAGRQVPGLVASFSTVATNLNANDFIGWAGAVYVFGVVMVHFPMHTSIVITILSLVLMKKLRASNAYTLGGWLGRRYNPSVGLTYSIVWLFVWMPFGLGLYIYAGSVVLHTLVGWNLYASIVILTIVAATYTMLGGFRAVLVTDVLQLFFMFFPLVILCGLIWHEVGGPLQLLKDLPTSHGNLWTSDSPWGAIEIVLVGHLIMAMSFWASDAQLVQRPIATRDSNSAAMSYIGAGFWYALLVPLLVIFPGLAAVKFFPNLDKPDFAMPMLLREFLPHGLYGVAIVGLLSGVFSSVDSTIHAFSTMFTTDIYRGLGGKAEGRRLLWISRVAGIGLTLVGIATAISYARSESGMFRYVASVIATIMPPIAAVTILGALSKRSSPRGAVAGLVGGYLVALVMLGMDLTGKLEGIAVDTSFFRCMVNFVVSAGLVFVVSCFDGHESDLIVSTRRDDEKTSWQVKSSAVLLAVVIGAMYSLIIWFFGRSV